jgi:hypothetical protein
VGRSETVLFREAGQGNTRKHVLNGATMAPLTVPTFEGLGPAVECYLRNFATAACSTGVVDLGVWMRFSRQCWRCALVRGRGIV